MQTYKQYYLLMASLLLFTPSLKAQSVKSIYDKHISNQQERMVYKQWDKRKFTPTKGFLGLNYQYWITWALHPNYPNTDRRPLSANGPQTLRLAMALAMRESTQHYKLHTDTLSTTALKEMINYTAIVSSIDPLWILYYEREFGTLAQEKHVVDPLQGLSDELKRNLVEKGLLDWYMEEYDSLKQRVLIAHNTTLDRGSRILSYHRLLDEYRLLQSNWKAKVHNMSNYIALTKKIQKNNSVIKINHPDIPSGQTDIQIAQRILTRAYTH